MTHQDFAVKAGGTTQRYVSDGVKAGIFKKNGTLQKLIITVPGSGTKMPRVTDENGNPIRLARVSKPCSCVGGVWKSRPSELVAQL